MDIEAGSLDRSIVVMELVVMIWCALRAAADLGAGPVSVEGAIAVGIGLAMLVPLLARAAGWVLRGPRSPRRGAPTFSSRQVSVGSDRVHAG